MNKLLQKLFAKPEKFDFFQAVHLLEKSQEDNTHKNFDTQIAPLNICFRANTSLGFPASSIEKLMPATEDMPIQIMVNFFGLTGANGALPNHFLALLLQQLQNKNSTIKDFFDIFNHRLISHYYKAWKKYQFHLNYQSSKLSNGVSSGKTNDQFTQILASLIGQATPGLQQHQANRDEALFYYTGLISKQPRSAAMLEAILGDYFNLPVTVQPFQGYWLSIESQERTRLPSVRSNPQVCHRETYNQLGVNTMIGKKIWYTQSKFCVAIGPLSYQKFICLLPNNKMLKCMYDLIRYLMDQTLEFDIKPILSADEVPYCQLRNKQPMQLGWNTWLKQRPFTKNADQLIIKSTLIHKREKNNGKCKTKTINK